MTKATDILKTHGIFNAHGYATHGSDRGDVRQVHIEYRPGDNQYRVSPGWVVRRPGFRTDPKNQSTMDHGQSVFLTSFYDDRAAALAAAQEWAGKRYGITEWARTPFGTYQDAQQVAAMAPLTKAST